MHNGALHYVKNADNTDRYYTWCYKNASGKMFPEGVNIPNDASTNTVGKATFTNTDDKGNVKWYVLTTESLEGLGSISGDATLTLKGGTTVGGSVFGGGAQSAVTGNTTVNLQENAQVLGDVFGGGDQGQVGGSATVNIQTGD